MATEAEVPSLVAPAAIIAWASSRLRMPPAAFTPISGPTTWRMRRTSSIVAPPFAGVFSMLTLPEQRRRGLAEAVLGAIARFALARGAQQLYLQVEVANEAARTLYARAGFREAYRYHYRRRVEQ